MTEGWQKRITRDQAVMAGQPVIAGTRLTVAFVLELLASGWTERQVLDNYPGVTAEDLAACRKWQARGLSNNAGGG